MKFLSIDTKKNKNCETEVRPADFQTAHLFIQTWVTDYSTRILRDPKFPYSIFRWDKIVAFSQVVGSPMRCFGAFTNDRLDGLLCLNTEDGKLKIEFIATAPWNYHTIGKMRRIGSGLIYYTIRTSIYKGYEGEFLLNAVPDAEKFYEAIGMIATGNVNKAGYKEYFMSKDGATEFISKFKRYVIKE